MAGPDQPFYGGDQSALPDSAEVFIINPATKQRGTVPKAQLGSWQKAGWTLETPEATTDARLQQEYGDAPVQAGLEGAARGVTLGLSDVALGQLDQEGVRERRNRNQGAAIAGEIGGGILGAFAPGVGLVGAAGAGVEEGVKGAKLVQTAAESSSGAARALARYMPVVAKGAVEGSIYGAGAGVSNVALSADPMSAEAMLQEIGSSALLGAGVGAGTGVAMKFLGDAAKTAGRYIRSKTMPTIADPVLASASNELAGAEQATASTAKRLQPDELPPTLRGLFGTGEESASGLVPTELPEGWTTSGRMGNAGDTEGFKVVAGKPSWQDLDWKAPGFEDRLYVIPAKDLETSGLFANPGAIGDSTMGEMASVRRAGVKMPPVLMEMDEQGRLFISEGRHRVATSLEEGGPVVARIERRSIPANETGDTDVVQFATEGGKVVERSAAKDAAVINGRREVPDEIVEKFKADYHDLDTFSRQDIRQMEVMEKAGKEVSDELRQAADDLEAARRNTRKYLPVEAERSYESLLKGDLGGSYAKGQGKSMQTWTGDNKSIVDAIHHPEFRDALAAHQEALDHMQALLGNKEYPPVIPQDHPVFGGGESTPVAPAKNGLDPQARAFLDNLDANPSPAATPPSVSPVAAKPSGITGKMLTKAANSAKHKVGAVIGGVIGHAIPGVGPWIGGLIGNALLEKPMAALTGKLLGRVASSAETMASGVDRLLASKGAQAVARKTTSGILGSVSFEAVKQSKQDKRDSEGKSLYGQRAGELQQVMGSPMTTRRQIHGSLSGVRAADPKLADQMETVAFNRLMFLADKMPKNPGTGPQLGKGPAWEPPHSELAKWARYINAAEHPETIMKSLSDGSITPEQVETLKAVYPETYSRIQMDIVNKTAELQKEIPWPIRVTLSALFEVPADNLLRPESLFALQGVYAAPPPEAPRMDLKLGGQAAPEATKSQRLASK